MRVLVECLSVRTGGGVQVALDVLGRIAIDPDIEAAVVCSREVANQLGAEIKKRFAMFVEGPSSTPFDFAKGRLTARELESKFRPDVVYTIFGPSYWLPKGPHVMGFAYGSLLFGRVSTRDYRNDTDGHVDYSSWKDFVRRWFLKRADEYLVEAEVVSGKLARYLRVPENRICVIGNTFGRNFESFEFRKRDSAKANILVPAPYYKHKNLEVIPFVAKALRDLLGKRRFSFTLTIPENSPEWSEIMGAAKELGVSENITTAGTVSYSAMPALYAGTSCVFLPTLMECFTAVYPESFQAGRPLVTSRRDFAEGLCGDAAAYCDPLDPSDCARQIACVLLDHDYADNLVASGTACLSAHYISASERYARIKGVLERTARIS